MADKHPYVTGVGNLIQALDQLRKTFPPVINAEWLKKLGIAPNNEGFIINVIRFLGLIDDQNARTEKAQKAFNLHDDEEFQKAFSEIVKSAYGELFSLYGDDAWALEQTKQITFFRQNDQSTQRVGTEQARTFRTLAGYAGHGEITVQQRPKRTAMRRLSPKAKIVRPIMQTNQSETERSNPDQRKLIGDFGLTVRIEINLPVANDQETYDRIFKSIRENLLNG